MKELQYLADMHTHTVASGHAQNTISEMAKVASERGLQMLGITEHCVIMPGTCDEQYFIDLKNAERQMFGVELCMGVELNIIDYDGTVDMNKELLATMDVAIASIHSGIGYESGTIEQNTNAVIGAIKNPLINIIGHPDDGRVPVDYEKVVIAAKEYNTLLEINNNSLTPGNFRLNPLENDTKLLKLCKEHSVPVIIGSDAHATEKVANHEYAFKLMKELDFPMELVMNLYPEKLKKFLNKYKNTQN